MSTQTFLNEVIAITQAAGRLLADKYAAGVEVSLKGAEEVVTEADRAAEALLYEKLLELRPEFSFFGEETGFHPGNQDDLWIVDPLDGTHNFATGIPLWGCSVGLIDSAGQGCLGVLDFPLEQKTYWAILGGGAWCNGQPLVVNREPLDPNSMIGVQSRIRETPFPPHLEWVASRHCARSLGSIAYAGAMVADGRMRACVDLKVGLYDVAAVALIVTEAGGVGLHLDGRPLYPLEGGVRNYLNKPVPFFAGDETTGPDLLRSMFAL